MTVDFDEIAENHSWKHNVDVISSTVIIILRYQNWPTRNSSIKKTHEHTKEYYFTSKQPGLKRTFHIPVVIVMKKTAFCFPKTVAAFILRYIAEDQPHKTTYSGLNPLNAELNPICHLLILLGDLTFMGPFIVSIFQYATHSTLKPVPTLPR
jgi:hypothetical protein